MASLVDLKLLMLDFTQPLRLMPPSGTEVAAQERATAATSSTGGNLIHVPMECATYDTEGICLTGPMQLKWVERKHRFRRLPPLAGMHDGVRHAPLHNGSHPRKHLQKHRAHPGHAVDVCDAVGGGDLWMRAEIANERVLFVAQGSLMFLFVAVAPLSLGDPRVGRDRRHALP